MAKKPHFQKCNKPTNLKEISDLPYFRSKQSFQSRPESPMQCVIDHGRLQIVAYCLQKGVKDMVLLESKVCSRSWHAAVAAFEVHLLKDDLTLYEGLQGHALSRVGENFKQLFHFAQFLDICSGYDKTIIRIAFAQIIFQSINTLSVFKLQYSCFYFCSSIFQ